MGVRPLKLNGGNKKMTGEIIETTETIGELQHELNCILEAEQQERQERDEADRCYQQELSPTLYRLRDYLRQLIVLLNDKRLRQSEKTRHLCMPEVAYDLSHIGVRVFESLSGRQGDYQMITSNQAGRLADFCLIYQCATEPRVAVQHVEFRTLQDSSYRINLQERLREHGLLCECVERPCHDGNIKMLFTLQPVIPVKLEFSGNSDGKSFQLRVANAGGTGKNGRLGTIQFPRVIPKQVCVEAIEALIQFIIRQPNQLCKYWEAEPSEHLAEIASTPQTHSRRAGISLQQTYNFDDVKAVDILSRIRSQPRVTPEPVAETMQRKQIEKLDKVQESLEEYNRRVEQEHQNYMAELEKIRIAIENGRSENRTMLSWVTALLFSKQKRM